MKTVHIFLLASILWFGTSIDIQAQNADKLFQQAMMLEEGEGNLKEAIDVYSKLVADASVNRNTQANALLHVGICYEKLESPNAVITYQKLISQYTEQEAVVAMGKVRLKGLKSSVPPSKSVGIVATQVWSPANDTYGVSPNGRYLNYIDWYNISLNLNDLKKETTRVISKVGTWKKPMQFPDNSIWSPDGKKLAYCWFENETSQLRIVNVDGSDDRMVNTEKAGSTPWPVCWSPDGKYILGIISDKTKDPNHGNHQIGLFSMENGSFTVLKSFEELQLGGLMDISSNNKYIVYSIQQEVGSKENDIYILSMDGKINKKVVGDLGNDYKPSWAPDDSGILFMSDRFGTNDLWKVSISPTLNVGTPQLVKANLGGQSDILGITNDKSVFYLVKNSRNDIYYLDLNQKYSKDSNPPKRISSQNENINPVISTDGRYIAYRRWQKFRDDVLGNAVSISIYDTKTGLSENFDTSIHNTQKTWRKFQWAPNGKELLLIGINSENYEGGLFSLDIKSKKITAIKVVQNAGRHDFDGSKSTANHVFSKDGKSIFYMSPDKNSILKFDVKSKRETTVYTGDKVLLYFKLSNDNSKIAFGHWFEDNKEMFTVSTLGGAKKKIFESDCTCSPNVISWSLDDNYIYFKEGSFRNLKKLMRISVNGGDPEEVLDFEKIFENGAVSSISLHPNGKQLAVELEVGKGMEVWKLEGVFEE